METVISQFKDDHYTLINDDDNFDGKVLYVDHHCSDMIVLPADSREYILDHDLLQSGHIVMQVECFWTFYYYLSQLNVLNSFDFYLKWSNR
jgi:hypothetical protein